MQVDRVVRLDRPEEILVIVDAEVRMVAALHQEARPAEAECLLALLENHRLRKAVALARVAGPPVERAEVATRAADIRVVEVAVDDERHSYGHRLAAAHLV